MRHLGITQVTNGFIVREDNGYNAATAIENVTHVFTTPEELGEWVTEFYVGLERKRDEESRLPPPHPLPPSAVAGGS